jgi:hypothetical protein
MRGRDSGRSAVLLTPEINVPLGTTDRDRASGDLGHFVFVTRDNIHMKRRVLVRITCVISVIASAGLGVDLAVAGLNQAAAAAAVIAGVAAMAALVIAVASWPKEASKASEKDAPAGMRGTSETAAAESTAATPGAWAGRGSPVSAGKYTIDARGAGNVQVGDGGTQHNYHDRRSRVRGADEEPQ